MNNESPRIFEIKKEEYVSIYLYETKNAIEIKKCKRN